MQNDISWEEKRLQEVKLQFQQAEKQLQGLQRTIENLDAYINTVRSDETGTHFRMSNLAWRKRASEMIRELIKTDKKSYPTFNSVLVPIYIKLRDVYGVVLDQMRKDYVYKYDTLRYPSAFEVISDDDVVREIFESLLLSMFPSTYFIDEAFVLSEQGDEEHIADMQRDRQEQIIMNKIVPLAIKRNDESDDYVDTFEEICSQMDCSWHNLQVRYMHKNGLDYLPSKLTVIAGNDSVRRKFQKALRILLEKYTV